MRHAGADAPRARRADGVQPARPADESRRGATRQLVGVPRPELTELLARALLLLGSERAWVVHGADGLDEISTTGYTKVSECRDGAVQHVLPAPGRRRAAEGAAGGAAGGDARRERRASSSASSPASAGRARDVVLLNAGAALFIAGRAASRRGRHRAARRAAIDRGDARRDARARWSRVAPPRRPRRERARRRADLLATIVAATRRTVDVREAREPLRGARARGAGAPRRAGGAFRGGAGAADRRQRHRRVQAPVAVARRPARATTTRSAIARGYAAAGAAAISVLTEPTFFDGALEHLRAVRGRGRRCRCCARTSSCREYQLLEARAAGADAVLLIVAALDAGELRRLLGRGGGARASTRSSRCTTPTSCDARVDAGARDRRRQQPQPADARRSTSTRLERSIARMPAGRRRRQRERPADARATCAACAALGYRRVSDRRAVHDRRRIRARRSRRCSRRGRRRSAAHDATLVKICGITRLEDAAAAVDARRAARRLRVLAGQPARRSIRTGRAAIVRGAAAVRDARRRVREPAGRRRATASRDWSGSAPCSCTATRRPTYRGALARPVHQGGRRRRRRDVDGVDALAAGRHAARSTRTIRCAAAAPGRRVDWTRRRGAGARGGRSMLAGGLTPENVGRGDRARAAVRRRRVVRRRSRRRASRIADGCARSSRAAVARGRVMTSD